MNEPGPKAYAYSVVDWRALAMLAGFLIVLTGVRYHGFGEPLETDEAIYALTARDWQLGGRPYVTSWDNKPIGIFVAYRAAIGVLGYNELAVRMLGLAAAAATGIVMLLWLRGRADRWRQGLGLLIWALANGLVACHANGTNAEVLMAPLLVGSLAACERHLATRRERWFYGAVGLAGLAFLIKPVALPFLVAPYLAPGLAGWRDGLRMGRRIVYGAALAVGMYLGVFAAFGYGAGTIASVIQASYRYAEAGSGSWGAFAARMLATLPFRPALLAMAPLSVPAIGGLVWLLWKRPGERWQPLAWYALAAAVAVVLPGQEVAHYSLLLLPFLVLMAVTASTALSRRWAVAALAAGAVWLGGTVWFTNLRLHPHQVSFNKYRSNWFLLDREIGHELRRWGLSGVRLFVDGTHPGVYFYSRNQPAVKYYLAMYYEGFGLATWEEMHEALAARPPEVLVFMNPLPPRGAPPEFMAWVEATYEPMPEVYGATIYAWKGGGEAVE